MTCGCLILTVVAIPSIFIWILTKDTATMADETFQSHWGVLYKEVKYRMRGARIFFLLYIIRRIALVCLAFFCDTAIFHIIGIMGLNLAQLMYVGHQLPLETPFKNKLEILNEICITMCSLISVCFTDFVKDKVDQHMISWFFIAVVSVCFMCNVLCIVYFGGVRLVWVYRWLKGKCNRAIGKRKSLKKQNIDNLQAIVPLQLEMVKQPINEI
jgi:hypothetical protein